MNDERLENPGPSPLTEGLKRKRGRPKKQLQEEAVGPLPEKKPRGRPKGSKKVSSVTGQMVEPPAGKRPRGRPRKWVSAVLGPSPLVQPQLVMQERASREGSPRGSGDLDANSAPAAQGIAGKDGFKPSKATAVQRALSSIAAAAQ
ncbi:high mobility group protein HMGI-C-like isoform X1 [Numida meleagris]|uniref:high mobility group protein HMGI-C-like isoform X1 n=1 Tax=Numida meleagris TaxID=8996 RepID=UPI000B3E12EE|nr:high mobility group protein HMGI-C-like isoform X1 [Numida meleagris]